MYALVMKDAPTHIAEGDYPKFGLGFSHKEVSSYSNTKLFPHFNLK